MAGTDKTKRNTQGGPAIVLVAPQLEENIGMAARAMANFGLVDLRLVNPREQFPSQRAINAATKAGVVVEQAKLFCSLEEAIADLSYVFAATARERDSHKPVCTPPQAMRTCHTLVKDNKKCGILFGCEKSGLLNEDISLADKIVTFPVNPACASLNLAQAVLLISYEWMRATIDNLEKPFFEVAPMQPAEKKSLFSLFTQLEQALGQRGYFRPEERKAVMVNNLRGVFTRPSFTEQELKLLRGVFSSLELFVPRQPR